MRRIYAAMQDEVLAIAGAQGRPRVESRLENLNPRCLAVDPLRPEIVYCGTSGRGLWRSADAGASWQPVGEGISHPSVTAVAVAGDGVLYAGTEPSALFRSEDGGISWRELERMRELPSSSEWSFPPKPWTSHVRWISLDRAEPQRLFVCIEAGALLRSGDGGETWEDRVPDGPLDTHTLSLHEHAPGRLYSSAGDGILTSPGREYSESRDSGETWVRFSEGLGHHYLWGLAVDPGDPETVIVSGAGGPRRAHSPDDAESTIYLRSGRKPWREVREGLPPVEGRIASVLAVGKDEPGVFYALNNHGIYRSSDAGESWEPLLVTWPERYRREHPQALAVTGDS